MYVLYNLIDNLNLDFAKHEVLAARGKGQYVILCEFNISLFAYHPIYVAK